MRRPRQFSPPAGMTLVELVVAILILALIGGIGAQSFLLVLRAEREMASHTAALRAMQCTFDELRRDISNLLPAKVGEFLPYSETTDPEHGAKAYRLLTRLPERYAHEPLPGQAQALLVEFWLEPDPGGENKNTGMRLAYSKQPMSLSGKLGEPLKGILAQNVTKFTLAPRQEGASAEAGAEEEVNVPTAIDATLKFDDPDSGASFTMPFPVSAQVDKKDRGTKKGSGGSEAPA